MGHKSSSINLVKKGEKSFLDKFFDWALTAGRFVVILTEFIALAAFLYRFSLDRQLIDLRDSIKQKQNILRLLKPNETKFRNLQTRIQSASDLSAKSSQTLEIFNTILLIAPNDFVFNKMSISQDIVRLEADVSSVNSLSGFVTKLKQTERVISVSIDKIENKTSSAVITVGVSAKLKRPSPK